MSFETSLDVANSHPTTTIRPVRQIERPVQDEWGIFDPQQAGFEAVLRKLQSHEREKDTAQQPAVLPAAKT